MIIFKMTIKLVLGLGLGEVVWQVWIAKEGVFPIVFGDGMELNWGLLYVLDILRG